jgi:hypothetical protein
MHPSSNSEAVHIRIHVYAGLLTKIAPGKITFGSNGLQPFFAEDKLLTPRRSSANWNHRQWRNQPFNVCDTLIYEAFASASYVCFKRACLEWFLASRRFAGCRRQMVMRRSWRRCGLSIVAPAKVLVQWGPCLNELWFSTSSLLVAICLLDLAQLESSLAV